MKTKISVLIVSILFALVFCGAVSAADTNASAQLADVKVPFVENNGQQPADVDYYADTYYGTAYITSKGITHNVKINETKGVALQEQFLDKNGKPVKVNPKGQDKSATKVSYYTSSNSAKWKSNISTYNKVSMGEVYPNITVKLQAKGGIVEKLFYLQPGANVKDILVQIQGTKSLKILKDGSLAINTNAGTIKMTAPVAYQGKQNINVAYKLLGNNTYGFTVGNYDKTKTLVIDPVLQYSTYLGWNGMDCPMDVAVDSAGNAYIVGYTRSTDLPVTSGAYQTTYGGNAKNDAFILKLNSTGTGLLYCTYFGGTDTDSGKDIALDNAGNIYITGTTSSTDFPVTTSAFQKSYGGGTQDVFVAKFDSNGSLLYSTYLGGNNTEQEYQLAVDNRGNIYTAGRTISPDFSVTDNAYQKNIAGDWDAFVSKIGSNGSLVYSTYLGGSSSEIGFSVAVDSAGNMYVSGQTSSTDFPVTAGAYQTDYAGGSSDAFVTKLKADGSGLVYSTFLGGTGADTTLYSTRVDSAGNLYATGQTKSSDFPVTNNAYQKTYAGDYDAFISKLNPNGTALVYSTYFGGSTRECAAGLDVDSAGNVYIAGFTASPDLPVTSDAYQKTYAGGTSVSEGVAGYDVFVSEFGSNGSLVYSTYLGGSTTGNTTGHEVTWCISLDTAGSIYVAGYTASLDFPVTAGAYQTVFSGVANEGFVAKFVKNPTQITTSNVQGVKNGQVTLTATLKDANNNTLSGKNVQFLINGTIVGSGTTNTSGIATYPYTITQAVGTYSVLTKFAGDATYALSEAASTLTVTDPIAPLITSIDPKNGATKVAAGKTIKVTFDEDIKRGHMWIELLNSKGTAIPFTATVNGNVLTVDPNSNLAESLYTLWIHTGAVTDLVGNQVAVKSTKFSVGPSPTVSSVDPINNKVINVGNKALVITFSEAIKAGSAFTSIKVTNADGVKVNPLYKVINGKTLTLTRNGNFINGLTYTITLPTGSITDQAGNAISTFTSKFKIDTTKPTVTTTNPANNKVINVTNKALVITFSEAIKAGSAFTSIKVTNPDGVKVKPLYKVINGKTLTLTRNGNYINGLTYTITLPKGSITDTAGNTINTYTSKFTIRRR